MSSFFVFIGPPGSGKGTQVEKISEKLKLPVISPGQIFRRAAINRSALGQEMIKHIKRSLALGHLVPDNLTNFLINKELKKRKFKAGAIFDGYPRTLAQAQNLAKLVRLNKILVLEIPDQEAIGRLSGRLYCPSCGRTYRPQFKPSSQRIKCQNCGQKLTKRLDDRKTSTLKRRLQIYHQEMKPIIKFYQKQKKLVKINGLGSIEIVQKRLLKKIKQIR